MTSRFGKDRIWILSLLGVLLATGTLVASMPLMVDEKAYYPQIMDFYNGRWILHPQLVTLPGYSLLMALFARILGATSIPAIRLLTTAASALSIIAVYSLAGATGNGNRGLRTAQFAFLPIVFPFFFLIYTDILSTALVVGGLCFALLRRHAMAGLLATASLFVRQNNLVWLALMMLLANIENGRLDLTFAGLRRTLAACRTHLVGVALLVVFVLGNKGFAVGDKQAHPSFRFHPDNLFFLLFLVGILFLPLHLANLPAIRRLLARRWKMLLPTILAVSALFWTTLTEQHLHPYNFKYPNYFLRNMTLVNALVFEPWLKGLMLAIVILAILSLAVTRLSRGHCYLLYPFTVLYLSPSWLIEQRYYLIPVTLFVLFREERSPAVEHAILAVNAALSVLLLFGIYHQRIFL